MKLLMHICCAPCANMPVDALRADGIDLTGYWYNPNIHPFTEYRARRNCLQEYAKTIELPLLVRDDYGLRPLSMFKLYGMSHFLFCNLYRRARMWSSMSRKTGGEWP